MAANVQEHVSPLAAQAKHRVNILGLLAALKSSQQGSLSQADRQIAMQDQDVMLARVLQEQERAFHAMLMAQIEPAYKTPTRERPQQQQQQVPAEALTDEELARQLQEQEDQEGFDYEEQLEVDYDGLSYEAYNALGDVAGAVSKGLPAEVLQQLPLVPASLHMQPHCSCMTQQSSQVPGAPAAAAAQTSHSPDCSGAAKSTMCVVCQCEFEVDEMLKVLPSCGHAYHRECIDQWLAGSKDCPICHKEVEVSNSKADNTRL